MCNASYPTNDAVPILCHFDDFTKSPVFNRVYQSEITGESYITSTNERTTMKFVSPTLP